MGKKRIIAKGGQESGAAEASARRPGEGRAAARAASGIAHIRATYNNTLIMITDPRGNALASASAGSVGFSGTRKATPYAAARVAEIVAEKTKRLGVSEVSVRVSGVGSGRDSAIRSLANNGLGISAIRDVTPIPHNGPRRPKVRRV